MRSAKPILLLLLIAAFVPYLYTSFFALPFADDFCFGWTASAKIPFIQKVLHQYLHWNGRYTSDVLVNIHPLTTGSLLLYQLVSFVSIFATPLVFFAFIKQCVEGAIDSAIAALFMALFYVCYLPNITDGIYWYIGLVNYHWGALVFILQLTLLIKLIKQGVQANLLFGSSLLLLIGSIGFNEIAAALIPAYYLAMLIYFKVIAPAAKKNPSHLHILVTHFCVAFAASAFVICSPGNFTRESVFAHRFNIIHSFVFAGLQTARFVARWGMSVPCIALSLLVIINAEKVQLSIIKKVHAGIWISLLLFTVFTAALIPYLATGILGQHRTINYVLPFFILLWICALISLSAHYGIDAGRTPETTGVKALLAAIVALLVISVSGNTLKIEKDIWTGSFQQYKTAFMQRQSAILQHPNQPIVPLSHIPNCFKIVDARNDTTWWVEKCMKHYYSETNVILHCQFLFRFADIHIKT
jgi:hypothetical protein